MTIVAHSKIEQKEVRAKTVWELLSGSCLAKSLGNWEGKSSETS